MLLLGRRALALKSRPEAPARCPAIAARTLIAASLICQSAPAQQGVQLATHEAEPAIARSPDNDASNVAIIRQLARARGGDPASLAHVVQLTRQLDPATSAALFGELADAQMAAGRLDLAGETRRLIAERFPDEPLAAESILWLVRLYASSEVGHWRRQPSPGQQEIDRQLAHTTAREVAPAAESADPASAHDALADYAYRYAGQVAQLRETWEKEPAFAYQRAVAARRAGETKAAIGLLTPLKHRRLNDPWGDAARTEAWLQQGSPDKPPRPIAACAAAAVRPKLDGRLDDACWSAAARVLLTATEGQSLPVSASDAKVCFAYDEEFLYLGIECDHAAGVDYAPDERPRVRDGDVEAHDRVRLRLDLDRDYATWFELTVDNRGWTAERCWGDAGWNPQWFVATANQQDSAPGVWIAEAAVPWSELTATPPRAGQTWACMLDRTAPEANGQSWPATAAEANDGPAAFGLLQFE